MSDRFEKDHELARRLMMGALDGELPEDERETLNRLLESDEALREEWAKLRNVKEVTGTMVYREPPEEIWDEYWMSVYNRFERGVGWILLSVGALTVFAWGLWVWLHSLFEDAEVPFLIKLAIFGMFLGLGVLFLSVIREKFFTRRQDPYKEIQR